MAFGNSGVFGGLLEDALEGGANIDLSTDTIMCALYGNTITPDVDVTSANSCHGTDQWLTDIFDSTNWDDGGEEAVTPTSTRATGVYTFDAEDVSQGGANCTLADVYGAQIYSGTSTSPADQGIAFLDFSGAQSVTSGDFTVQFHANGIMTITFTAA